MALACPVPEHPVGDGSFCRICGRSYLTVPDPVLVEAPVSVEHPAFDVPPAVPPLDAVPTEAPAFPELSEPVFKHQSPPDVSPFAELHVGPDLVPQPPAADPVLDTGLIDTRFAELTAPLGDLANAPAEREVEAQPAKASRVVPPAAAFALAGAGGALVMALLDRLVL